MKNILLVINDMVLPNKGGGAPRLYAVARAFKRLGYNPIVFCPLGISAKEAFDNGAFYCTTCKMCKENCPVRIDLSDMIKKLREKLADKGLQPKGVEEMMKNVREYGNPFGNVKDGEMPDKLYCC